MCVVQETGDVNESLPVPEVDMEDSDDNLSDVDSEDDSDGGSDSDQSEMEYDDDAMGMLACSLISLNI